MIHKCKRIAKDIFNELGSGYEECIYQKAFEVALRLNKIPYENQRIVPIFYRNHNIGESKPDIIVNKELVIELKATGSNLSPKEETQLRKYMEVLKIKKGLLINFPQAGRKEIPEEPEFKTVEN